MAVVIAHEGKKSPYTEELTADFVYARMHGEGSKFKKGYPKAELGKWAKKVKAWKRESFVYFDTEEKKYAPQDAMGLGKLLFGSY